MDGWLGGGSPSWEAILVRVRRRCEDGVRDPMRCMEKVGRLPMARGERQDGDSMELAVQKQPTEVERL